MNIYKVKGLVELAEWVPSEDVHEKFDGYYEMSHKTVSCQVEAESEQEAVELALKREQRAGEDWQWEECYKPFVELVREIPESEMMRRVGAPRLFD